MKIERTDIKGIIRISIENVTGSADLASANATLEQAGVDNKSREVQFKQTLIEQTLEYLSNHDEVDLQEEELIQLGNDLHSELNVNPQQTLGSFENFFSKTVLQSLPGDSTNEKDEER
ncbi:MAG: hypothetical protein ACR2MG_12110 [Pyrinomonadaceae bacterium]